MIALSAYSIEKVYLLMMGKMAQVEWRKVVWSNCGAPIWLFILYLAVNKRLATNKRLSKWGLVD